MRRKLTVLLAVALALTLAQGASADGKLTSPKQQFGWNIGDDYRLATYTQLLAYFKKLDQESERMKLEVMGKTAEGRDQVMAVITSPANHQKLARYKEISQRLARAEGLTEQQARALAQEGKAVVWFDGGLHATEVLGAHQLVETVYQLLSRSDPETLRILNDLVILAVHANPDGMELVSNWYMREPDEKKRVSSDIPRLYQKYIGHDNNRDFYMNNQPETRNMSRILFQEWHPQIMYNHHQTGPTGAVLFAPPFRDPFNYNFDPGIPVALDLVGAAMHNRFVAEGKPGATMRRGANYSTWWNGGLRTTVYFHNMIGLLTETIGNPTPIEIEFVPQRALPNGDTPFPVAPQKWHFRQSVDYSVTANYAVFDVASRYREQFLYNIYKMGRDSIERGSRDSWTVTPKWIEAVRQAADKERRASSGAAPAGESFDPAAAPGGLFAASRGGRSPAVPLKHFELLRDPKKRDARGYVLPSGQPDFPTATKFVNALQRSGVVVHRASAAFTAAGKSYPAGSYVVKTAQAFRPHVLDMFEPQDHPNDFGPGGAPIPPYDNAGWTLAYQMGIEFDRILDGFDGPFERLTELAPPPAAQVRDQVGAAGYLVGARTNDSFLVANRLLKAGAAVFRVSSGAQAGAFYVEASPASLGILQKAAVELGVGAGGLAERPSGELRRLALPRIGLWDRYGGSMPSGWIRWLLEQYEFPYEVVYPQGLDAGNLSARFDVLIFPGEAIPERDGQQPQGVEALFRREPAPERVPDEFRGWLGRVSVAKTVPQLKAFAEAGGTILTIGSSTALARQLELPVHDHLIDRSTAGERLSREKFYVPGSVLRVAVANAHPLAWGMGKEADVLFDNSPVMRLSPDAALRGVQPVAWFASAEPLRSGWAWGQHYLEGGVAVADAAVGKGRVLLFGPEITFRGQAHCTFKLLFNGIYR